MSTPEERREAHILGATDADPGLIEQFGWWNLKDADAYDRLLAYFDETEPAVAEAIRYSLTGIPDAGWREDSPYSGAIVSSGRAHSGRPEHTEPIYRIAKPTICPHGDPCCPCPDGDSCHYEWAGDSPPLPCAHCGTKS